MTKVPRMWKVFKTMLETLSNFLNQAESVSTRYSKHEKGNLLETHHLVFRIKQDPKHLANLNVLGRQVCYSHPELIRDRWPILCCLKNF